MEAVLWAAGGTGFTFLMTILGSALVFLFRDKISAGIQRVFLGFAAGVMIAASVCGRLLVPAIEDGSGKQGGPGLAACGRGRLRHWARWIPDGAGQPEPAPPARRRERGARAYPTSLEDGRRCWCWPSRCTTSPRAWRSGLACALASRHGGGSFPCDAGGRDGAVPWAWGMQNFPEGCGHFAAAAAARGFPGLASVCLYGAHLGCGGADRRRPGRAHRGQRHSR